MALDKGKIFIVVVGFLCVLFMKVVTSSGELDFRFCSVTYGKLLSCR